MKKKTIAVLFGGKSAEYKVSLCSAYGVLTHLDKTKYNIIPIGITSEGEWFHYFGEYENILDNTWNCTSLCCKAFISPDRKVHGIGEYGDNKVTFTYVDCIFPVLHGKNGEDGTVQGLAQLAGIKMIGCDILSSALSMDKHKAHIVASSAGIKVPKGILINRIADFNGDISIFEGLNYPLYVKPVRGGSSIGMSRITDVSSLKEAIYLAFQYDTQVIVEEEAPGFEVGCAIIGSDTLTVGNVDEIEMFTDFFDYHEKYTQEKSKIHLPARISKEKQLEIQAAAKIIYRALGCSGLARVDMFLTPEGEIVFNEVNTLPGLTPHSRFPRMLQDIGLSFSEVLDTVIEA